MKREGKERGSKRERGREEGISGGGEGTRDKRRMEGKETNGDGDTVRNWREG